MTLRLLIFFVFAENVQSISIAFLGESRAMSKKTFHFISMATEQFCLRSTRYGLLTITAHKKNYKLIFCGHMQSLTLNVYFRVVN